jgi:hypothetical protein
MVVVVMVVVPEHEPGPLLSLFVLQLVLPWMMLLLLLLGWWWSMEEEGQFGCCVLHQHQHQLV